MSRSSPRPDQRLQGSFDTPTHEEIPGISKLHVEALESSVDDAVWIVMNMHYLVLHTIGRRTGKEHKVALPFWLDLDDHPLVVASFAGADTQPAWFLNLAALGPDDDVVIRLQSGLHRARPEVLTGTDRTRNWDALVADRPFYDNYRKATNREIPLVRFGTIRSA